MRNAMSVDVEDWYQVGAFERVIARADWAGCEDRVVANCERVLALFARAGVHATFFTLGWVAERHPALIRRIAAAGHEVASHGVAHDRIFMLSPTQFADDLDRAKKALEDAAGVAVTGYRAPSFSLDQRTPWAHRILAERGYTYSSSVAPIAHDHYGWRAAPRTAWRPVPGSPLIELPVTTLAYAGRRIAAGGGGFFRVLPAAISHLAITRMNRREAHPAAFYFHPWEVDPDQPRVAGAPLRSRLRHYTRLGAMEGKLERLLNRFAWGRYDQVVAELAGHLP